MKKVLLSLSLVAVLVATFAVGRIVGPEPATAQGDDGDDAAPVELEAGQVALAIPIAPLLLPANLEPGSSVDVLMAFPYIAVDPEFQSKLPNIMTFINRLETGAIAPTEPLRGRIEASDVIPDGTVIMPSESQRPRWVAQAAARNALVVAIAPPDDDDQPAIVTLGVTPQQAVNLTWAIHAEVPVTLAVRAPDLDESGLAPASLNSMIDQYSMDPPDLLDVALGE